MSSVSSKLVGQAVSKSVCRATRFIHNFMFGSRALLVTNAIISASMGAVGDSIQQNYDILMGSFEKQKDNNKQAQLDDKKEASKRSESFNLTRTAHMAAAGLTTGVVTHYWYIFLERALGSQRTAKVLTKKILIDQMVGSPMSLLTYFVTLGVCERSSWRRVKEELVEKGLENIYVAEWMIWPPLQLINFALLPLRYRILFDNIVSLGFDIYCPYVKYKTSLKSEQDQPGATKEASQLP